MYLVLVNVKIWVKICKGLIIEQQIKITIKTNLCMKTTHFLVKTVSIQQPSECLKGQTFIYPDIILICLIHSVYTAVTDVHMRLAQTLYNYIVILHYYIIHCLYICNLCVSSTYLRIFYSFLSMAFMMESKVRFLLYWELCIWQ